MAKTIVNNNIKLKSGGGLVNSSADGLSVDGQYSLPVYEPLSDGDLVKSLNDNGVYKAAKIVGLKTAVTQSITKAGDLVQVEELNATTLLILTTTKLYKADWNSSTGAITNLIEIAIPTVPTSITVLDSQTFVCGRLANQGSDNVNIYVTIITIISGTVTIGTEQTTTIWTTGTTSWREFSGLQLLALSSTGVIATCYCRNSYSSSNGRDLRAISFTVTGLFVTFGTPITLITDSHGTYGSNSYRETIVLSSNSFAVLSGCDVKDSSYRPTPQDKTLHVRSIAAGVITGNSVTAQTYGDLNTTGSLALRYYDSVLYLFMTKGSTTEARSATIAGTVPTLSTAVTLTTAIKISYSLLVENSVYIVSGTSIYSFRVAAGQIKLTPDDSLVDSNLYKILKSTNQCYTFSNDNAIKTTRFLLDKDILIGIADKSYTTDDDFVIQSIYKKVAGDLIPGVNYCVGADGQSLVAATTTKKVGRAISDTLIVKE